MPRSYKSQKYILCIIDEVTNYLIIVPMHQAKSEEMRDALIENVITKYSIPEHITVDLDSTVCLGLLLASLGSKFLCLLLYLPSILNFVYCQIYRKHEC